MASQLRKRKVKVNVKNLSKMNCVSWSRHSKTRYQQQLQNEVMEAFQGNEEIRDDELMGMRWVATIKQFPDKVKARLVILGFQARDLEDEFAGSAIAYSNTL